MSSFNSYIKSIYTCTVAWVIPFLTVQRNEQTSPEGIDHKVFQGVLHKDLEFPGDFVKILKTSRFIFNF